MPSCKRAVLTGIDGGINPDDRVLRRVIAALMM